MSVAGGASSHAAIIARGLGLPMLAGADPAVLAAAAGHPAILDAGAGELIVDPDPQTELDRRRGDPRNAAAPRAPAVPRTRVSARADGEPVTLLCNVASAAETRLGLSGGAAGVGLLRTEIPFTGASAGRRRPSTWPRLTPVLGLLAAGPAVVRLLDFSGDKIPPFLADQEPGLAALLGAPEALRRPAPGDPARGRRHSARRPGPDGQATWTRWPRSAPRSPRPPPRPASTRPSSA